MPSFSSTVQVVCVAVAMAGIDCDAAESKSPVVVVQDVAGRTHSGTLSAVDENQLQLTGKSPTTIPRRDLFRVDFNHSQTNNRLAISSYVLLSTGERISVTPQKIDGDDLHGKWNALPGQPAIRIPLMSVRALILQPPDLRKDRDRIESAIRSHKTFQDVLILRNGDRVSGRLDALTETTAKMSGTTGTVRRSDLRAVIFNPRYIQQPKPTDTAIRLMLSDGSQLAARRVTFQLPNSLQVVPFFGGSVRIPLATVATVQFFGSRVTPLSSRKPAVFEFTPFIAGERRLSRDRNVIGGPLRLRGRTYGVGLGMHSRSRVTYELTGDDKQFLATVGIDDAAKGKGHAVFIVELDGKPVHKSPVLTGKSSPHRIGPISLTGHKRLTLFVDYGPFGDVFDYADWCDAILIGK